MGAFDHIEAGTDVAELLERRRFEHAKQQTGEAVPAPPAVSGTTVHTGWPPCR